MMLNKNFCFLSFNKALTTKGTKGKWVKLNFCLFGVQKTRVTKGIKDIQIIGLFQFIHYTKSKSGFQNSLSIFI